MPGPEPEPARIGQRRHRLEDAIEVEQRLAHAHEHDVRQARRWSTIRRRAAARTWSTISAVVRSRLKPSSPVAQNGQPTAQPAWLEMHTVWRSRCWPRRSAGPGSASGPTRSARHRPAGGGPSRSGRRRPGAAPYRPGCRSEKAASSSARRPAGRVWIDAARRRPAGPQGVVQLAGAVGGLVALGKPGATASDGRPARPGRISGVIGSIITRDSVEDHSRGGPMTPGWPRARAAPVIGRPPAGWTWSSCSEPSAVARARPEPVATIDPGRSGRAGPTDAA